MEETRDETFNYFAPAKTPLSTVSLINHDVNVILDAAEMRARLAADGADVVEPNTAAQFKETFAREMVRWDALARDPGSRQDGSRVP